MSKTMSKPSAKQEIEKLLQQINETRSEIVRVKRDVIRVYREYKEIESKIETCPQAMATGTELKNQYGQRFLTFKKLENDLYALRLKLLVHELKAVIGVPDAARYVGFYSNFDCTVLAVNREAEVLLHGKKKLVPLSDLEVIKGLESPPTPEEIAVEKEMAATADE